MSRSERVSLPERVGHLYYSHGLLCSSHPVAVLTVAVTVILLCCYPLLNLPLPGDIPQQTITEAYNFTIAENLTMFAGSPYVYIQQIVLKTGVSPWRSDLVLFDAFRAPLSQVFNLLQLVSNYQHENSEQTLGSVCLHIESVKLKSSEEKRKILPEYNCLVLSPANLWQQNLQNFQQDSKLLNTVFSYHNIQKGKISLTEILFGVSMKESGMKRYPLRSRPRTLQFAITLVLETFDLEYISGLRRKLETAYPLHISYQYKNDNTSNKNTKHTNEILHIFYPGEFSIHEFMPLTLTYVMLFLYIYFSMRKIELIKSKIGIALSAVVTIISSLCMSVGLCFFFGLTFTLSGREIFPYLVAIVGLENVLVLTKSITNVPSHLDVKIRVAQGLSREGWSITKNLLTEVTILTVGIFTFVPGIQQICIFGIVGIVCDFLLHMCFFTTILSIDIFRLDKFDKYSSQFQQKNIFLHNINDKNTGFYKNSGRNLPRSKSHHNLTCTTSGNNSSATYPANILAPTAPILNKLPKRLRLVNIWASTRFFQRALMLALVTWMCCILYSAGYVEQLFRIDEIAKFHEKLQDQNTNSQMLDRPTIMENNRDLSDLIREDAGFHQHKSEQVEVEHFEAEEVQLNPEDMNRFRYSDQDPHRRLSLYHWPALLSLYNISLTGRYISILPAIRLAQVVPPDVAKDMRNPDEKMEHFQWKNLAVALDPLDFTGSDGNSKPALLPNYENYERPIVPSSPMEIALASILVLVSVLVLGYTTMVLYRCICTRNYAEWRSSWEEDTAHDSSTQVVLEAVAMTLDGHPQEVECLATDGMIISSSCLAGQIRVWNATSGELLSHIDRKKYFSAITKKNSLVGLSDSDLNHSDYESGSPPSRGESEYYELTQQKRRKVSGDFNAINLVNRKRVALPDLKPHINYNFSNIKFRSQPNQRTLSKGFDYGPQYKSLFQKKVSNEMEDEEDEEETWKGVNNVEAVRRKESDEVSEESACKRDTTSECEVNRLNEIGRTNLLRNSSSAELNSSELCVEVVMPPIWCLDCQDNLVVIGCSNGRLELWEGSSGQFKYIFEDGTNMGITSVRLIENNIVAARLNGFLDLLWVESYTRGRQMDWGFTSYRRTHVRTGSAGSAVDWEMRMDSFQDVRCIKVSSIRAHQQPITVLDCENGRIVTGSHDHTLKVLRLEDQALLYTLHGHCGPITCMFIDRVTPFVSGSGSQDGLLCVWDLLTGACMYNIQAHDGSVIALTYSPSYVISLGTDDKLCVWERFLGHLLNTIQVVHTYCSSMVMLTHNLLVTSRQGSLVLWDVRTGEPVRVVRLGNSDHSIFVKQIHHITDSVVCDYGNQLRIVQFPIISDKTK